jgi:hypothetical protein
MSIPFTDTVIAVPGFKSDVLATFTKLGMSISLTLNDNPQITQIS